MSERRTADRTLGLGEVKAVKWDRRVHHGGIRRHNETTDVENDVGSLNRRLGQGESHSATSGALTEDDKTPSTKL